MRTLFELIRSHVLMNACNAFIVKEHFFKARLKCEASYISTKPDDFTVIVTQKIAWNLLDSN